MTGCDCGVYNNTLSSTVNPEDDYIPLSPLQGEKGGERGHPSSVLPPVRSLSSVSGEQLPWYRDLNREKRERTATEGESAPADKNTSCL